MQGDLKLWYAKQAVKAHLGLAELGLNAGREFLITDVWSENELPVGDRHTFQIGPDGVAFLRYEERS